MNNQKQNPSSTGKIQLPSTVLRNLKLESSVSNNRVPNTARIPYEGNYESNIRPQRPRSSGPSMRRSERQQPVPPLHPLPTHANKISRSSDVKRDCTSSERVSPSPRTQLYLSNADDRTYISILKSDILLLQAKFDEIYEAAHSNRNSSSGIAGLLLSEPPPSNEMDTVLQQLMYTADVDETSNSKLALMEILSSKMIDVEKRVLLHTQKYSNGENAVLWSSGRNVSRLPSYIALVDRILYMFRALEERARPSKTGAKTRSKRGSIIVDASNLSNGTESQIKNYATLLQEKDVQISKMQADINELHETIKKEKDMRVEVEEVARQMRQQMNDGDCSESRSSEQRLVDQTTTEQSKQIVAQQNQIESLQLENEQLQRTLSTETERLRFAENELEKLKSKADEQIERHEAAMRASKKQVQDNQQAQQILEADIASLREQLAERDHEVKNFDEERERLQQEIQRLLLIESKFLKAQKDMEMLVKEQQVDEKEQIKKLQQMQAYLKKVEENYEGLKQENQKVRKENESMKEDYERKVENIYKDTTMEIAEEKQKRQQAEDKYEKLTYRLLTTEREASKLKVELEEKEKLIDQNQAQSNDELMVMTKSLDDLHDKITTMEEKLKERDADYEKLQKNYKEERLKSARQRKEIEELREAIANLEKKKPQESWTAEHKDTYEEVLLQELRTMREAFERKLASATSEVELMRAKQRAQLKAMQDTINAERKFIEIKLKKYMHRCSLLEQKLSNYEHVEPFTVEMQGLLQESGT